MKSAEIREILLDVLERLEFISAAESATARAESADIEFGALGIDSMAIVDICMGVEEKMDRELRVEAIIEYPTVDQLAAHLGDKSS